MVLYLPYIAFMIIFAIVFGLVGLLIDNKIYSDYFGRSSPDAFIFSAMIGIFVSWIFTWFIRKPIYKFILKKNYDDRRFIKIMNEKSSPTGVLIFSCVLIVATCILIFMFGCFNGFAFDNDGNVYYKETPFSQNEVVAIDEIQFFDSEIVSVVRKLAEHGKRVIASGLDLDFKGEPFGSMPELLWCAK